MRTTTGLALSNTAREAILLAAEERERFGHKHTGTEHLLLGIIRGSSDAAKMLERRGLTIDRARDLVSLHDSRVYLRNRVRRVLLRYGLEC